MFKRRRPDPEKKHVFSCKMHSFRTIVVIRFKMWQIPRRNSTLEEKTDLHFEALAATEYVCNIKYKITVDKFRSCTSHKH